MIDEKKDDVIKVKKSTKICLIILLILAIISSIFCIYELFQLRDMGSLSRYFNFLIILLLVLDIIFIFRVKNKIKNHKRKKKNKPIKYKGLVTAMIIYFLINALVGGTICYVYGFVGSFNKEYVTYSSSLVTLSSNTNDDIKKIKNFKIGILKDKKSVEGYIIPSEVIKKYHLDVRDKIVKYDTYNEMMADLYDSKIDAMFTKTAYPPIFENIEGYENVSSETKIIYTEEKKMLKSSVSGYETSSRGKNIKDPFTILLMGVDSTDEGLTKDTVANGDSLVLITFNPKTLNATMLSIPRDSYVPIACWNGKPENKITHAAAYGNECMMSTIENYFDTKIDYYAKINFKGLVKLVDAMGGIDVEVPQDLCTDNSSRENEVCISKGMQHLDGEEALVLSRNRKQLKAGDLDRGRNQQLVIQAMVNKIKTIRSASQFMKILNTISNNFDTNFTTNQILSFYSIAEDIMKNDIAKDDSDLISIDQLYLQGDGQMIYDERARMVLWNYVPNKESRKDIINAMKTNLGLLEYKDKKSFSFSINDEYEKKVVGYGPYKTNYLYKLVPNFVGYSESVARSIANRNGIRVSFVGTGGTVISQNTPINKRVDKLNSSVVLTLSSTHKKNEDNDNKKENTATKKKDEQSNQIKNEDDDEVITNNNEDDDDYELNKPGTGAGEDSSKDKDKDVTASDTPDE